MRALIVDGAGSRSSLAAARALAEAGWLVGVATSTRLARSALSRFVRHRHRIPKLTDGADAYLDAVVTATGRHSYDIVLPSSDAEMLLLSRDRHRIPALVPYPAHDALVRAMDKRSLGSAAQAVGIESPPIADSADEGRQRWGRRPLVVKESLHGAQRPDERHRHFAAERFDDAAMAQVRVQEIRAAGGVPLVQPAVSGRLMAFTSVVDRSGAMLARVQQVADRTYPLGAGLSARAHTVAIDEELSRSVSRLLAELAWRGLSELQFMVEGNARPVLLDFNGRFYGSLSLALAAGVNLPDVWARAALGQPEGAGGGDAVPGVRYQWLTGDLKAVRESQASGLRELAGCLWHARHVHASSWRRDDPGPAIVEASSLLGQSVRVVARRVAHKQERPIASPR